MKRLLSILGLLLLVTVPGPVLAQTTDSESLSLVPYPRELQPLSGTFSFADAGITILDATSDEENLAYAAEQLAEEVWADLNLNLLTTDKPAGKSVLLEVAPFQPEVESALKAANLSCDSQLGSEGYVLLVEPQRIVIAGNEPRGVFYGVQTLKQLIRGHAQAQSVPCLKIRDWPMLRWRGVLDDISRGPIPTMEFFKACIRRFSELKLNALTYYTENVVRTKMHPAFAPRDALTLEEIRELTAYAAKHHIDLVGSFQSFGHFEKILEYPQYEHLGEMGTLLTPADEASYRLLSDVYAELSEVYPSKLFAIYGDEVWALGKGASESMVAELGKARVYADHMNRLHDELAKLGKQSLVTADVILEHPETLDWMRKDVILLPWNYSPRESFMDMIAPLQEKGFTTIVTPGVSCWRRIFPNFESTIGNIRNFVRDGVQLKVMGMLNTTWDDWGTNFFSNNWYGVAFGADQSWHSVNPQTEAFSLRFAGGFYGDGTGNASKAIRTLSSLSQLTPMQGLETTVFWQKLIPAYGVPAQLSLAQWDEIATRGERTLTLLDECESSHYSGDLEYIRFAAEQVVFMADFRRSLIEAGSAYRNASLNQENRDVAGKELKHASDIIDHLEKRWNGLAVDYKKLWLQENRPHSLELVLEKFQEIVNDLADVRKRLSAARTDFEDGFALPPPVRVRLDIRELQDSFFQTWLLCGSFPNPKKESGPSHAPGNCLGFDTDYFAEFGGEANVRPKEVDRVPLPDGTELTWQSQTTNLGAKVDLAGIFEENQRTVAYAYCTIASPVEQTVKAAFGSNDGIKVFLNGQQVFETHGLRFVKIDEDKVDLPLKNGVNHLLLKIDQGRGKWGFAFRLLDVEVRNLGFTYSIHE